MKEKDSDDFGEKFVKLGQEKEKCIICGAETIYSFDTPISQRKYYIEGAGQLCERCYYLIYYGIKRRQK